MIGFVGAIVDPIDAEPSALNGACFDREHFVWADHVVAAALGEAVQRFDGPESRPPGAAPARQRPGPLAVHVERVYRHPTADVAVLLRRATSGSSRSGPSDTMDFVADGADKPAAGYILEFEFMRESMRQDQRERHGFLGFTLAANGLILGLLMDADAARKPQEILFLIGLVAVVTLAAEQMTIRATQGVATAGAYLRLFVEPHVEGLKYQRRNRVFPLHRRVISSRTFAVAYLLLTGAFASAWAAAPINQGENRRFWQWAIVAILVIGSCCQIITLLRASKGVDEAWEEVRNLEQQHLGVRLGDPESK